MSNKPDFLKELGEVRPVTRNLIEAILMDSWPDPAAITDFGLDSQLHYEALYYPIRQGEISPKALDAALGHGRKLTELVQACGSNPHREIAFHTSWDGLFGRRPPDGALPEKAKLLRTLDRIAAGRGLASSDNRLPAPEPERDR